MSLSEIRGSAPYAAIGQNRITASQRFVGDLPRFASFPGAVKALDRFVEFRKTHRADQTYNIKDAPYTPSGPLRGLRHCHVVLGKVIVVYKDFENDIRLMRVISHDEQEGKSMHSLAAYCRSLNADDFAPFAVREQRTLEDGEIAEINDLIFGLLTNESDREILEKAASGNFNEFMDFARFYVETTLNDDDMLNAIFIAFDGRNNLMKFIDRSLRHSEFSATWCSAPRS